MARPQGKAGSEPDDKPEASRLFLLLLPRPRNWGSNGEDSQARSRLAVSGRGEQVERGWQKRALFVH